MAKDFERRLKALKVGETLRDPRVPGLRYRCRTGGVFAELRFKDQAGRWRSTPLGKVSREQYEYTDPETGKVELLGQAGAEPVGSIRFTAMKLLNGIEAGVDPRSERGPDGLPLRKALDLYKVDLAARNVVDRGNVMSLLRREVLEPLGNVPLPTLDRATLVARVNEAKTKPVPPRWPNGRPGMARHLKSALHSFLSWAADEGHVPTNPLAGSRKRRRTRAEKLAEAEAENGRALSDDELRVL